MTRTKAGGPRGPAKPENLEPPRQAAVTHGCRMRDGWYLYCEKCPAGIEGLCDEYSSGATCLIEREHVEARMAELEAQDGILPLDRPLIAVAVWSEIRVLRAARALAVSGEVEPGWANGMAEPNPLAKSVGSLVNTWLRTLEAINLTPAARQRAKASIANPQALAWAQALQQLPPASEPVDAEVIAAEEGDNGR